MHSEIWFCSIQLLTACVFLFLWQDYIDYNTVHKHKTQLVHSVACWWAGEGGNCNLRLNPTLFYHRDNNSSSLETLSPPPIIILSATESRKVTALPFWISLKIEDTLSDLEENKYRSVWPLFKITFRGGLCWRVIVWVKGLELEDHLQNAWLSDY